MKNAEFVPVELISKFDNIIEAARALENWKKENRGPGRPRTRDCGVKLSTLKKMVKTA